jgi:putative ABC transport system permease protein
VQPAAPDTAQEGASRASPVRDPDAVAVQVTSTPPRTIELNGIPLPSHAYAPKLSAGRWLEAGDTYAIVLAEGVAKEFDVEPGDWVRIQLPAADGRSSWVSDRDWQVMGLYIDPNIRHLSRVGMVPRDTLLHEMQDGRVGNRVLVQASLADPATAPALAAELRAAYDQLGIEAAITENDTVYERSTRQSDNIRVVTTLLFVMAAIVAAVGGIALSGVLSIGVLERRREIGVLRAIGATPRTVRTLFMTEGLILGWLSWLITLLCSYPVVIALAERVAATVGISILYRFSWPAVAAWLLLASLIGVLAAIGPAQGAIRASVQESLAYE